MSDKFERILNHKDGRKLHLIVKKPIKTDDENGDWQCEYSIEGLGSSKIRKSVGGDQVQAIFLAFIYLSNTLYFSEDYKEGKISWEGGMSPSDLGLPVADTVRADVQRLREQVDRMHGSPSE